MPIQIANFWLFILETSIYWSVNLPIQCNMDIISHKHGDIRFYRENFCMQYTVFLGLKSEIYKLIFVLSKDIYICIFCFRII